MNRIFMVLTVATVLFSTGVMAEDVSTKVETVKVEGFYAGLGFGGTFNAIALVKGDYVEDGTNTYNISNLGDSDIGYLLYAGYQFNKIIAVEASFTDYGSFSDTLKARNSNIVTTFESAPKGGAIYANAGYTFNNGWRPFGQLGLGYIQSNPSASLQVLNNFSDGDFMTMHYGFGVEYAPVRFRGFGVRVAYSGDMNMDWNAVTEDDNGNIDSSAMLMRFYGLLYIGAQYKF